MTRLALVMIVRDEERSLSRCITSVKALVDRIIVMDTGSSDRTVDIAKGHGAELHHMDWPHDFAAARNAALDKSDADWNLILDADEWLASGGEALGPATLPSGRLGRAAFTGCLQIADAIECAAPRRSYLPRLLPHGVRYEGQVHEQPMTNLPLVRLPILVLHDGYDAAQLEQKVGRNEHLLHAELAARPDDPYLLYQLGRQYLVDKALEKGAESLLTAYHRSSSESAYRHSIVIYTLLALRWTGRLHEALTLVDAEQDNWDHSPDFYFAVAELYLEWASHNIEIAHEEILPVVEAAWLKCLQIGENPDLDGSVVGSGSFRAARNLANLYEKLGLRHEASRYAEAALKMTS